MKTLAITESLTKYQNQWVALNDKQSRVLASGKSLKAVITRIQKNGSKNPVYMKVLSSSHSISPACYGV